jgi:hypothetical protein
MLDVANEFRINIKRTCLAKLSVKFYLARSDLRAFIIDSDLARAFTGAIIHKLFAQSMRSNKTVIEQMMPRKSANKINWSFRTGENTTLILGQGDISSFTASNPNSWLLVLTLILGLKERGLKHLNNHFLVSVEGELVSVCLQDVLQVYLFRTIFMDILDKSTDEIYFTCGGSLGVMANMTLTKIAFVIFALELANQIRDRYGGHIRIRIAGDDFVFLLRISRRHHSHATRFIETQIRKQVGHLKEYKLVDLGKQESGSIVGRFCQKNLIMHKNRIGKCDVVYRIVSVCKLPIMVQMFKLPRKQRERQKKFLEMVHGIQDLSRHLSGTGYVNLYAWLFYKIHGEIFPCSKSFHNNVDRHLSGFYCLNSVFYTRKAWQKMSSVPSVIGPDRIVYRDQPMDKSVFLMYRKALDIRHITVSHYPTKLTRTIVVTTSTKYPWVTHYIPVHFIRPITPSKYINRIIQLRITCKSIVSKYERLGYNVSYDN